MTTTPPPPPDWLPISPEAQRHAWELAQNAPPMSAETRAAVAILLGRPAPAALPKAA